MYKLTSLAGSCARSGLVLRTGVFGGLLILLSAFGGAASYSQTEVFIGYSQDFGGTSSVPGAAAAKVAGDTHGNAYVTGSASLPLGSSGSNFDVEALTIKYDPHGHLLWKAWLKAPVNSASGVDIAVDAVGNAYVLMRVYTQRVNGMLQGEVFATAKYNVQGVRQWINYFSFPGGNAEPGQIRVTRAGNVYVSGSAGPTGFSDGPRNVQLIKYDTTGKQVWSRQVNHVADDVASRPSGLGLDAQENVFIAFRDNIANETANRTTFCEYSESNSPLRCFGAGEFSEIFGFHIDEAGNSYFSGAAASSLSGASAHNNTLAKHNPDGSLAWKLDLGPVQPVLGGPIFGIGALTTDSAGNVLVLERRSDSAGEPFAGLLKFNSAGVRQWEAQHTNNPVGAAFSEGQDLVVNAFQETYILAVGTPNGGSSSGVRQILAFKYGSGGNLIWETNDPNEKHSNMGSADMAAAEGNLLVAGFGQESPGLWVADAFVQDAASLATHSLEFGSVPDRTQSAAKSVTLTNASAQPLPITSITVTGDFHQTNSCPATLVAGESCTISVIFTPTDLGVRTGTLVVRDPFLGSEENPQSVQLSGTGVN